MPGLVAALGGVGVAVHRIAGPNHGVAGVTNGGEKRRQVVAHVVGALPGDECQAAGDLLGVERFAQGEHLVRCRRRADLAAERVLHASKELDMGAVELAGALADPEHVGRAVVPIAGEGVLPGQRFFVVEEKRFVAREEVDFVQGRHGAAVDAARIHEGEGAVDLAGHLFVPFTGGRGSDEFAVPGRNLAEVGIATSGEGPQQVQCGGGPVVGGEQSLGVGATFALGEADVVDDLAEEGRQLDIALGLDGGGAGFGELPGDTADLNDRQAARIREDDRHLEDDAELVANRVGGAVE